MQQGIGSSADTERKMDADLIHQKANMLAGEASEKMDAGVWHQEEGRQVSLEGGYCYFNRSFLHLICLPTPQYFIALAEVQCNCSCWGLYILVYTCMTKTSYCPHSCCLYRCIQKIEKHKGNESFTARVGFFWGFFFYQLLFHNWSRHTELITILEATVESQCSFKLRKLFQGQNSQHYTKDCMLWCNGLFFYPDAKYFKQ